MTEQVFLSISETDLKNLISDAVSQAIDNRPNSSKARPTVEYMTGKEVDAYLKISSVTRHKYAKDGVLTKYKFGTRTMYRRDEIEKVLKAKITT